LSLQDGHLVLTTVPRTRTPAWRQTYEAAGWGPDNPNDKPPPLHALDVPEATLLAFQLSPSPDGQLNPQPLQPGNYASALAQPAILHDRWQATATVAGQTWHLYTTTARRKDGALLAGSLSLIAQRGDGMKRELLPPTNGAAFERQELLWLGSMRHGPNAWDVDFLLKRTLLTGEVQYVLRIDGALATATLDPDHPYAVFSSGADAYRTTDIYVQQTHALPPERFGSAAFTLDEEPWNAALDTARKDGLPKLLFDRQLMLDDEKLRVTVEYLPRMDAPEGISQLNEYLFWRGPLLIKAHFRGKTQVLLESAGLDSGNFNLQLDKLDGATAIRVTTQPHYNNAFVYYWVWDVTQQRFVRLLRSQSQGC